MKEKIPSKKCATKDCKQIIYYLSKYKKYCFSCRKKRAIESTRRSQKKQKQNYRKTKLLFPCHSCNSSIGIMAYNVMNCLLCKKLVCSDCSNVLYTSGNGSKVIGRICKSHIKG